MTTSQNGKEWSSSRCVCVVWDNGDVPLARWRFLGRPRLLLLLLLFLWVRNPTGARRGATRGSRRYASPCNLILLLLLVRDRVPRHVSGLVLLVLLAVWRMASRPVPDERRDGEGSRACQRRNVVVAAPDVRSFSVAVVAGDHCRHCCFYGRSNRCFVCCAAVVFVRYADHAATGTEGWRGEGWGG